MAGKIYNFEETEPVTKSVYEFITEINSSLGRHSGRIEGEVTSLKNSYPTAVYFSIKDTTQDALLNCVIWRNTYNQNSVDLKEGDKVIVTGTPEIYAARGSFSLKVKTIEYAGEGMLKKAYDELRLKLSTEGLLAGDRKRQLPLYPERIGVITSRSGVVIQDFNTNLGRYGFKTCMVDSRVEGKDAIHEILAALRTMALQDIQVLVIIRGGGSWESLQAFNTESVVRAIASFPCPVVTGIGHDVDVTLSELVADIGTSTPTAVAEALNQSWDTLTSSIGEYQSYIINSFQRHIQGVSRLLDTTDNSVFRTYYLSLSVAGKNLAAVTTGIHTSYRSLERTITKANTAYQILVGIMRSKIQMIETNLATIETVLPKQFLIAVTTTHTLVTKSTKFLVSGHGRALKSYSQSLSSLERSITLSDPKHTLKLGYSLTYVKGKLIRSTTDINPGQSIETMLADGSFTSEIKNVL